MTISEINKKFDISICEYRELYYELLQELYFIHNTNNNLYDVNEVVKENIMSMFYPLTSEYYISKRDYEILKNKGLLEEVYYLVSNPLMVY